MTGAPALVQIPADGAEWPDAFAREAARISALMPGEIALHHIGSTAVPGCVAKPIVDMLGLVRTLPAVDTRTAEFQRLGYEAMGPYGIAERRYFRKRAQDGRRTHHLHVFVDGSAGAQRHIAFRDYLRRHPEAARAYSDLKATLAAAPGATWDSYVDGKDAFVQEMERAALRWYGAGA
ncbi:MAG: GrpB family protein [Pseudomonadota bacterium]